MHHLLCSHLEAEIDVLDTVAYVDATEVATSRLVIGSEASPEVVSNNSHLVGGVWLDAPAAHGQISGDLVEEVRLENCVVSEQSSLLCLILHVSEVRIVREAESSVAVETTEGHIPLNFVCLSQTEGAMRADLAIVFDSHDRVEQTVLLDKTTIGDALAGVLRRCVLKRITLDLLGGLSFVSLRPRVHLSLLFDINVSAVSDEGRQNLVVLLPMLRVHVAELLEDEVV
mmetsp:Transcript_1445/g.2089  ORF Transcript_1445/g.2089 Transcript_1445/m.2089 type:complete len:228 (-) Transcript_1445:260-943(-)